MSLSNPVLYYETESNLSCLRFLLPRFQIDLVLGQSNLRDVRRALTELPDGIYRTYDGIMERIEQQEGGDPGLAKRALSYVFGARRPLNVTELIHAMSIETDDTELDKDAFPDIDILLSASAGLLLVNDESKTIELVHPTLQVHFKQNPEQLLPDFEAEIARACLTYLSFEAFKKGPCDDGDGLEKRLLDYRLLEYASQNWGHHITTRQLPQLIDLVTTFLGDHQKLSSSIQTLFLTSYRKNDWYLRYPGQFGPLHMGAYWGLKKIITLFLGKGIYVDAEDSYGATALQIAAKYGHVQAVELLLSKGANIDAQNHAKETALYWAARNGHNKIVGLLVTKGADITPDDEGWTGLNWAILGGNIELVKVLLPKVALLGTKKDQIKKALYLAAEEGQHVMVQELLNSEARVNAQDHLGSTALDYAVAAGQVQATQELLDHTANVNLRDKYGNSALHWAVPQEIITRLLLDNEADVHAKNNQDQTPLCWAVRDGPTTVAQLLLGKKAEVNVQDKFLVTGLHTAARRDCEEMMQLLLDKGADPNTRDRDGWTPLHWASAMQHDKMVEMLLDKTNGGKQILQWMRFQKRDEHKRTLLVKMIEEKCQGSTVLTGLRLAAQESQSGRLKMMLEKGADVNAKDTGGWTALELAASNGFDAVVQLLWEHGADVNIRGSKDRTPLFHAIERSNETTVRALIALHANVNIGAFGETPLMLATQIGNISILEILIKAGAQIDAQDYRGQTALHRAAICGHEGVAQLLKDKGADLNIADDQGETALVLAIENSQSEMVEFLLVSEVAIDARAQDRSTALHQAVFICDWKTTRSLLDRGAEINASTRDGFTPLHIAALRGLKNVVELLLRRGADVEATVQWDRVKDGKGLVSCGATGVDSKSLSQQLHELVLEKRAIDFEEGAPHTLTPRQVAAAFGHQKMLLMFDKQLKSSTVVEV